MELDKNRKGGKVIKEIGLTNKEVKFARCVAEGMSKVDAYIKAGYSKNMKRNSMTTFACELSKKYNIATQIHIFRKEFTKKLDSESQITVERQLKRIETAIEETSKKEDWNTYLKALDMQSKLTGIYAPIKSVSKNLNIEVPDGYVEV